MKNGEKLIFYYDNQVFNMITDQIIYIYVIMVPEDNIDALVEVTRRLSRATDLYAAFLLYILRTHPIAHARETHTSEILSVSKPV
jgi:hypothetical protein